MGFFEIGIYHTKTETNVGTLWRSAYQLDASGIFTIGRRYKSQCSDTYKTPRNIPLRHFTDFGEFMQARPLGAVLVGVEIDHEAEPLSRFTHPKRAIYLLGAEDGGLPRQILSQCNTTIYIESMRQASYNVAIAGSLVMYHRLIEHSTT